MGSITLPTGKAGNNERRRLFSTMELGEINCENSYEKYNAK